MNESDITCITETWGEIPPTEDWLIHNCFIARDDVRRGPGCGGVALLHQPHIIFKIRIKRSEPRFQFVFGLLWSRPLIGCYISPKASIQEFQHFLALAQDLLRGPGILIGDLNARAVQWDDTHNRRGPALARWARLHNFCTQRPPSPTMINASGQSRVDLCLHRHKYPPALHVHEMTTFSDHAPVTAHLRETQAGETTLIPLSLLRNNFIRDRIRETYRSTIPDIIDNLNAVQDWTTFEKLTKHLSQETINPWIMFCPSKSNRFRPGWSRKLDRMAKRRSLLWGSSSPDDRREARKLDKQIKTEFRTNVRAIRADIGDCLRGLPWDKQSQLMSRALKLTSNSTPILAPSVNPDMFTNFMKGLQPHCAPKVQVKHFTVPTSFLDTLIVQIERGLKQHKAPGPDLIRLELLQLDPKLFGRVAMSIWSAVGRLAFVPSLLRRGTLSPIYKNKGDASLPTNNRPICLISVFRKLIAAALTIEICRAYPAPDDMQWGFRKGCGTECAVAFAVNSIRRRLPLVVLLDLKKAYDMVPRVKLHQTLESRLPSNLANSVRPLLGPMLLKTRYQRNSDALVTLSGVPQGDTSSPVLFNLFMDTYLRCTNTSPTQVTALLFVDDV